MNETPAKYIKSEGLRSLQYVADQSDTPRDTLARWYLSRPNRFKAIVAGIKTRMDKGELK